MGADPASMRCRAFHAVRAFVADGPLPGWDANGEEIDRRERRLTAISRPVTPEEAAALATCFGSDDGRVPGVRGRRGVTVGHSR